MTTVDLKSRRKILVIFGLLLLIALMLFVAAQWRGESTERKPLYWVSQMDPNYRSSTPGLCPHGMELIPVYAEDLTGFDAGPGVVRIAPQVQQQMGVRRAEVKFGQLQQTLRVYGRVVPDAELVQKIRPRVKGWVEMLFVHAPGENVKRGQPLYALYSPELVQAQEAYLQALKTRSTSAILNAEATLRALHMDDLAITQLKNDGVPQRSVIFRASKDGMVDMLNISEGDYVRPKDQLLVIASMERVWLDLEIFESQASQLKTGQALRFTTPAHPGLIWEAEIAAIYPDVDKKSRTLRFRAAVDNSRMLLRPNMQVEAIIALNKRKPALLAPRNAVIDLGAQQRVVLDAGDGHFKSVRVTPGESNGEEMEILEGLQEGDVVVTSAHFLIDSESSKTSDFLRMEPIVTETPEYPPTWVAATIKEIQREERVLRLQHDPVTAWKMPGMTMNFKVVEAVDMRLLEANQRVQVQIADGDPLFQVLAIKPADSGTAP
jgi:RND family efflux transporter, MFP subunit